jgi:hypothetical protein
MAPTPQEIIEQQRAAEEARRNELRSNAAAYFNNERAYNTGEEQRYGTPANADVGTMGINYSNYITPQKAWDDTYRANMLKNASMEDRWNLSSDLASKKAGQGIGSTAYTSSQDKFNTARSAKADFATEEANKAAMGAENLAIQRDDMVLRAREAAKERAESARRFGIAQQLEKNKFAQSRKMDALQLAQKERQIKADTAMNLRRLAQQEISEEHAQKLATKNYNMAMRVNLLNAQLQDREMNMKDWVNKVTLMYQSLGIRLDFQKLREAANQAAIGNQLAAQGLILKAAEIKANTETAERLAKEQQKLQAITIQQAEQKLDLQRQQMMMDSQLNRQKMLLTSDYQNRTLEQQERLANKQYSLSREMQQADIADRVQDRLLRFKSDQLSREQALDLANRGMQQAAYQFDVSTSNDMLKHMQNRLDASDQFHTQEARLNRVHDETLAYKKQIDEWQRDLQRETFDLSRRGQEHSQDMDMFKTLLESSRLALTELETKAKIEYNKGRLSLDGTKLAMDNAVDFGKLNLLARELGLKEKEFERNRPKSVLRKIVGI